MGDADFDLFLQKKSFIFAYRNLSIKKPLRNKRLFEQIFRDNYTRLYYHALNILNDSENSRDVVNDVFEYVWTHYDQFRFDTSIAPLLFTLVRNYSVNFIRHRHVEEKYQQQAQQGEVHYQQDYDGYEETMQRLTASIEQLPAQTRYVFTACFLNGKKYQEVGEELHISVNTVKTHISKALRILRAEFSGQDLFLLFLLTPRHRPMPD